MPSDYMEDFEMPDADAEKLDRKLNVRFSMEARIDRAKTEAEGKECYRDIEFISIFIPGDKTLSVHRPVMPVDKNRFRLQYKQFKDNASETVLGTPLSTWALIGPSQRKDLEYLNCRSVEQLAGMSDIGAQSMHGLIALRQKAQNYLKAKEEDAGLIKMVAELQQRDDAIAALQAQVTALAALAETKHKGK